MLAHVDAASLCAPLWPNQRLLPATIRYPRSQAVATAESTQMKDGADKLVEVLARLAKVCQVSAAGAAGPAGTVWHSMLGVPRGGAGPHPL